MAYCSACRRNPWIRTNRSATKHELLCSLFTEIDEVQPNAANALGLVKEKPDCLLPRSCRAPTGIRSLQGERDGSACFSTGGEWAIGPRSVFRAVSVTGHFNHREVLILERHSIAKGQEKECRTIRPSNS